MNQQSYDILLNKINTLKDSGVSQDDILSLLKDENVSIIDAIRLNRVCFKKSLGESKQEVSIHPSWQYISEKGDKFHQELIDNLNSDK